MQIRNLEYFVALARERHFRRAAERCGVSQPTLSAGIGALEAALGVRLVARDRRFVDLTPEGEATLPFAQQMLADHDSMLFAAGQRSRGLSGRLSVGVIPAAMPAVGALAPALAVAHPLLELSILSLNSREIERGLAARSLDAGVTYLENEPLSGVIGVTFYGEHYLFATPAEGAFAAHPSITWAQAAAAPLGLLSLDMQNRRILDAHLARIGLSVSPRATANSYVALLSMIRLGGLSSILPHIQARGAALDPAICVLPFADPSPPQAVGLVVLDRYPMSPLSRAALDAARSAETHRRLATLRLPSDISAA